MRSEVSAAKACALPVSTWGSEEVVSKWWVVRGRQPSGACLVHEVGAEE